MTKYLLLALLATVSTASAAERFFYMDREGVHEVQPCFVDPLLRRIPDEKMEEAMKHIAVRAVKMDNGEYALHAHVRGLGGGPLAGVAAYWTTKAVGYAGIVGVLYMDPLLVTSIGGMTAAVEVTASYAAFVATAAPTP